MMGSEMFYLASPMVNPYIKEGDEIVYSEEFLNRNEKVAKKLERAGISIYLPQRDTKQKQTPRKIFADNLAAIKRCDALIVILSDTRGIYLEAGYAKGMGKKIVGLKVDETRPLGIMVRNFFDYIAENTDELAVLLNGLKKESPEERGVDEL